MIVPLAPVYDKEFMPVHVKFLSDFKKTPLLLGVDKDEGAYFLLYAMADYFGNNMQGNPAKINSNMFTHQLEKGMVEIGKQPIVIDAIKFLYTQNILNSTDSYFDILDDIFGDYLFKCSVVELANLYSNAKLPVYLYSFEHQTRELSNMYKWPKWMGVMHGYEIDYVFGVPLVTPGYTEEERSLSRKIMKMWSTFAKTGL